MCTYREIKKLQQYKEEAGRRNNFIHAVFSVPTMNRKRENIKSIRTFLNNILQSLKYIWARRSNHYKEDTKKTK